MLAVTVWSWAGRSYASRWWMRSLMSDSLALGVLPGIGLGLTGIGLYAVFGEPLAVVGGLLLFACFPVFVIGFFTPRWWGPGWYRQMSPQQRQTAQRDVAGTFLRSRSTRLRETSTDLAARSLPSIGEPMARWRAGYVYDADTSERTHALSRRGTVDGTLTAYPEGVVFAATQTEDGLRGEATVVAVPRETLTGVRVVPARAGADGRPRPGVLHRSFFPRLVLDTTSGSQVFEVAWGGARRAAVALERTLARPGR